MMTPMRRGRQLGFWFLFAGGLAAGAFWWEPRDELALDCHAAWCVEPDWAAVGDADPWDLAWEVEAEHWMPHRSLMVLADTPRLATSVAWLEHRPFVELPSDALPWHDRPARRLDADELMAFHAARYQLSVDEEAAARHRDGVERLRRAGAASVPALVLGIVSTLLRRRVRRRRKRFVFAPRRGWTARASGLLAILVAVQLALVTFVDPGPAPTPAVCDDVECIAPTWHANSGPIAGTPGPERYSPVWWATTRPVRIEHVPGGRSGHTRVDAGMRSAMQAAIPLAIAAEEQRRDQWARTTRAVGLANAALPWTVGGLLVVGLLAVVRRRRQPSRRVLEVRDHAVAVKGTEHDYDTVDVDQLAARIRAWRARSLEGDVEAAVACLREAHTRSLAARQQEAAGLDSLDEEVFVFSHRAARTARRRERQAAVATLLAVGVLLVVGALSRVPVDRPPFPFPCPNAVCVAPTWAPVDDLKTFLLVGGPRSDLGWTPERWLHRRPDLDGLPVDDTPSARAQYAAFARARDQLIATEAWRRTRWLVLVRLQGYSDQALVGSLATASLLAIGWVVAWRRRRATTAKEVVVGRHAVVVDGHTLPYETLSEDELRARLRRLSRRGFHGNRSLVVQRAVPIATRQRLAARDEDAERRLQGLLQRD
jgi:hypothetical protein